MNENKFKIIGVTGSFCSGKDTVADYLVQKGWQNFSLSDEIREVLKKEGKKPTRNNLVLKGNELRRLFGTEVLAEKVFKKLRKNAVVTSIRNLGEIDYFKRNSNFYLIFIDAPIELRYKRTKLRSRETDKVTFDQFKRQEQKEKSKQRYRQQLNLCKKCADYIIINDKSIKILNEKIESILGKINEG